MRPERDLGERMRLGEFEVIEPLPADPADKGIIVISILRPWINVGRVGTLVLTSLERHLGASELGRLARPGAYFDFTRYRPRTRIVEGKRTLNIPNTIVNYATDDENDQGYMFLHIREPHSNGEDYANAIASFIRRFNVVEHCRIGGMYDSVPHTRPVMVTGTMNSDRATRAEGLVSMRRSTYQGPTSIVNLVSTLLEEAEIESSSLMAHLPQYVQLEEDHMGKSRLMEVLCSMYGFPDSLIRPERGRKQYQEINSAIQNNNEVRRLIRQFEQYYDRIQTGPSRRAQEEEDITLAPSVEGFLRELGERLGDGDAPEDDVEPDDDEPDDDELTDRLQ